MNSHYLSRLMKWQGWKARVPAQDNENRQSLGLGVELMMWAVDAAGMNLQSWSYFCCLFVKCFSGVQGQSQINPGLTLYIYNM